MKSQPISDPTREERQATDNAWEGWPDPGGVHRSCSDAHTGDDFISGGEVIDPGADRFGILDVAIRAGRNTEVPGIPAGRARQVIDATGCIVVPGLTDLHTHVFWGGTYWGVNPACLAHRTGLTTWIDVGSSGAFTVDVLKRSCVQAASMRIKALRGGELVTHCTTGQCMALIGPDGQLRESTHQSGTKVPPGSLGDLPPWMPAEAAR